jgi:hypothetical protein
MAIFLLIMAISLFLLLRSGLVLVGWLKEPIIRGFERYGDPEQPYLPLLPVMIWGGIFLIALGTSFMNFLNLSFPSVIIGLLLLAAAAVAFHSYDKATTWHFRFLPFPRWYHELRGRTSRYERRRIGYMWLRLPLRTRLAYNSSDQAFLIWADFIIMGAVTDEEDPMTTPQVEC